MSDSSASPLVRTILAYSRCSGERSVSSSRPVMPITPFMGVRISWLMLARNSLLAALAASACAARELARAVVAARWRLVSRRVSSARLRSVMSSVDPNKANGRPWASHIGTLDVSIQMRVPSACCSGSITRGLGRFFSITSRSSAR